MKNIIISTLGILVLLAMMATNSVMAEERYKAFEMGESGHVVLFKMTPVEIAEEDAANARLAKHSRPEITKTERWVEEIEIGETGTVIEFEMSPGEIKLAEMSLRNAGIKEQLKVAGPVKTNRTEIVEMADGHEVTFQSNKSNIDDCNISWVSQVLTLSTC